MAREERSFLLHPLFGIAEVKHSLLQVALLCSLVCEMSLLILRLNAQFF